MIVYVQYWFVLWISAQDHQQPGVLRLLAQHELAQWRHLLERVPQWDGRDPGKHCSVFGDHVSRSQTNGSWGFDHRWQHVAPLHSISRKRGCVTSKRASCHCWKRANTALSLQLTPPSWRHWRWLGRWRSQERLTRCTSTRRNCFRHLFAIWRSARAPWWRASAVCSRRSWENLWWLFLAKPHKLEIRKTHDCISSQMDVWLPLPSVIIGSFAVTSGLLSLLLPETRNRKLPDTIEEAEEIGRLGCESCWSSLLILPLFWIYFLIAGLLLYVIRFRKKKWCQPSQQGQPVIKMASLHLVTIAMQILDSLYWTLFKILHVSDYECLHMSRSPVVFCSDHFVFAPIRFYRVLSVFAFLFLMYNMFTVYVHV